MAASLKQQLIFAWLKKVLKLNPVVILRKRQRVKDSLRKLQKALKSKAPTPPASTWNSSSGSYVSPPPEIRTGYVNLQAIKGNFPIGY